MQHISVFACGLLLAAALEAQPPAVKDSMGMPPRLSAAEYSSREAAGDITIGAEFLGHSLPTGSGILKTEDYVAVEAAVFGKAGARATVSPDNFTLRINGKKAIAATPFELIASSIKDPEWAPPETKSKTGGVSAGGGGDSNNNEPPPPPRIPPEVRRANEVKVRKTVMPEGDRVLPIAGLLFFRYGGQEKGIHEVELDYNGPNGKAKLVLQ
jgi:hypothetical protein